MSSNATKTTQHPKYADMITAAITTLKERNGSSRQAICKYVKANYSVGETCDVHVKLSLKRMVANQDLVQTKGTGASGSFKVNKVKLIEKAVRKTAPRKSEEAKENKKPAAKKTATAKKSESKTKKVIKKGSLKPKTITKKVAKKPVQKPSPRKSAAKKPTPKKAKPGKLTRTRVAKSPVKSS